MSLSQCDRRTCRIGPDSGNAVVGDPDDSIATIAADADGEVATIHVGTGNQVEAGDLLITLA